MTFALAWILAVLAPTAAFAAGRGDPVLFAGAGMLSQNMNRFAAKASGESELLARKYFLVNLIARIPLERDWLVEPSIGYTPLGYKSKDDAKSTILDLSLPLARRFGSLEARLGPGLQIYKVSGPGGQKTMPSGSSTASFWLPSSSNSTKLFFAQAGLGIAFTRWVSLDADLLLVSAFTSRRAVSAQAAFNFGVL